MNRIGLVAIIIGCIFVTRCAPIETISSHNFASGYYYLGNKVEGSSRVYADLNGDSLTVYRMKEGSKKDPDPGSAKLFDLGKVGPDDYISKRYFIRNSLDADLSTVVTKLRPAQADVPPQLNSNLNAALYLGARRDFFSIRQHKQIFRSTPFIRQTGFDAGLFAGIGISFISPTTTAGRTELEYDGIVFQKGAAVFFTFDNLSIGVACGFDNLLGDDARIWIYNNKPWIGLTLGIANF